MSERRIGLGSAVALVVASMIGTGVFTTSGFALGDLGRRDLVVAAWVVGGLVALAGAASYGALARHIPEDGGEYTFLSQTLHPALGVVAGWVSMLAGFTAPIAAAALLLHEYLAGSFAWPLGAQLTATSDRLCSPLETAPAPPAPPPTATPSGTPALIYYCAATAAALAAYVYFTYLGT